MKTKLFTTTLISFLIVIIVVASIVTLNFSLKNSEKMTYGSFLQEIVRISKFVSEDYKIYSLTDPSYFVTHSVLVTGLIDINNLKKYNTYLKVDPKLISEDKLDEKSKKLAKEFGVDPVEISYQYPDQKQAFKGYPTCFKTIFYSTKDAEFIEVFFQYDQQLNLKANLFYDDLHLPISVLKNNFDKIGVSIPKLQNTEEKDCKLGIFTFSKKGMLMSIFYYVPDNANFRFLDSFIPFVYNENN
ncbi:MAG: hypothetical protein ACP5L3_06145 [Caldisericum sp.]|jgi:hypothetical protein|uniref:Uncharacterized protein n=1 Tax=Caldisericum exile TaxID=693075 RepID=A0A2J6WFP9_9BACT|nr:MAG: hypothetical protein C0189_00855 [Caldisericum exile]